MLAKFPDLADDINSFDVAKPPTPPATEPSTPRKRTALDRSPGDQDTPDQDLTEGATETTEPSATQAPKKKKGKQTKR